MAVKSSKAMILYEQPVLLNRDAHRKARLGTPPGLKFAAGSNSFLLAAEESVEAMRDFPIVFVGNKGGAFTLAALAGLQTDSNLFVQPDGGWIPGAYLPAFVRRYPFVLVEGKDGDDMQIAVDETCPWLDLTGGTAMPGERLLTDEGQNTQRMDDIAVFLLRFHRGMEESREFATKLHELGLLAPRMITVKGPRGTSSLDKFWLVDEDALRKLDAATTKMLADKGYMAWIHFHLASLANVQKLADLSDHFAASARPAPTIPAAPRPLV